MFIIGLTGGIASGKSTVSKMLKSLGAVIIDADQIAHAIIRYGEPAWQDIVEYFGKKIVLPDGSIDRQSVGNEVFNNPLARAKLEEFTHPRIRQQIQVEIAKNCEQGVAVSVADIPLLLEVGWQDIANEVWVVYVKEEVQLARLMSRNAFTREQAVARIRSQMPLSEKIKVADIVIDNSESMEKTIAQVTENWNRVMKYSQKER